MDELTGLSKKHKIDMDQLVSVLSNINEFNDLYSWVEITDFISDITNLNKLQQNNSLMVLRWLDTTPKQ